MKPDRVGVSPARRAVLFMEKYSGIHTKSGDIVLSYEYIEHLRKLDREKSDPLKIMPQKGCQEKFVASNADITIIGGNRGGGKSYAMLLEALPDINNKFFVSVIFRKEKKDFDNLEKESSHLYAQFGKYNRSQSDMTWNFNKGGSLTFSHFSDTVFDFKERFRGKQYSYIAIDELPQMEFKKFKFLTTCNRNAARIRNRIVGTCNPDPDSWVRKFIDWWIGEDGLPVDERDGIVRYCFMDGDTPDSIYWGDTPEEVYLQCKQTIDKNWKPEFEALGFNKITMFVKSVTFIRGKLEENVKLIASDPNYVAGLVQQDEEQRSRDLEGNWNFKNAGDDMIKMRDMERFFAAPYNYADMRNRATCDIAFTGGDSLVLWHWIGWHIDDIFVCRKDSKTAIEMVRNKLAEWGVMEEDFAYDLNGLGQAFRGFFKRAVPFNNLEAPIATEHYEKDGIKAMYANVKSQCAYLFAVKLMAGEISINENLLGLTFSGDGFEKTPLRQILMKERKCIRRAEDSADKGFTLIQKKFMKKYVGHSPDYFESLIMRYIFELKRKTHKKPKGLCWI